MNGSSARRRGRMGPGARGIHGRKSHRAKVHRATTQHAKAHGAIVARGSDRVVGAFGRKPRLRAARQHLPHGLQEHQR